MGDYKQLWAKAVSIYDSGSNYNGFMPSVTILPEGYCHKEGYKQLDCEIVWERDQAVVLRDKTTIYTDVFRPNTDEKVPVIISWSPYGKSNIDLPWAYDSYELSHLQKEEGVDPLLWCKHGYAVAHPDARGSYMSEGNILQWGHLEGQDIYDYIEWLAEQEWCSGKIGMAGNSYLSIAQWFAAEQKPPHLAAIAPWEGQTDAYREVILQGGILNNVFPRQAISVMHGNNYIDDMPSMAEKYPLINSYWEDKRAKLSKITIPAYIAASYTNPLHTFGTFRGYREIMSEDKWLRVHNSHEWVDFYKPENQKDLMKFFDYYLKGIENDWKKTSPVRYSLLNPGGQDITEIAASQFPPEGTKYKKYYLNVQRMTLETVISEEAWADYTGEDKEAALEFRHIFKERTELAGYPKVKLFIEGINCEDMDLFVEIGKEDVNGKLLNWNCVPYNRYQEPVEGFDGRLAVSLGELDLELSTAIIPVHKFIQKKLLKEGEIAEVEIPIRCLGLIYEQGETLVLRIGNELRSILKKGRKLGMNNLGIHRIHMGGFKASYLQIPLIKK